MTCQKCGGIHLGGDGSFQLCEGVDSRISKIFYREFQNHPASVTDPALALDFAREAASSALPAGVFGAFDDEALTFTQDTSEE